jgi:DNA-binding response OmpR family regulator
MPKKILVVDDSEDLLELYKDNLEDAGFEVTCATDGIECGVKLFDEKSGFDAIIMDLHMPNKDGHKTILHLRHGISKSNQNIKIFVVSAFITPKIEEELNKYGIAFFKKPLKFNELVTELKKI